MRRLFNRRGMTMVELLVAMVLFSVVISAAWPMVHYSLRSHREARDELALQSDMRLAAESISTFARHGTVSFLWPRSTYAAKGLTAGWNYLLLEDNNTKLVNWRWNASTNSHEAFVLAEATDRVYYGLEFSNYGSLEPRLKFRLDAFDSFTDQLLLSLESELGALNAFLVDDSGTDVNPSAVLVYKDAPRPVPQTQVTQTQVGIAITLVLDVSGSMAWNMSGGGATAGNPSRLSILKSKTFDLLDNFKTIGKVYVAIVPFSTNANPTASHPQAFLSIDDPAAFQTLRNQVTALTAGGGTNVGDGIRRAYHHHASYAATYPDAETLHYMMLLMDGNPTYWSTNTATDADYQVNNANMAYVRGTGNETGDNVVRSMPYIQHLSNYLIHNGTINFDTSVIGFNAVPAGVARAQEIAGPNYLRGTYYSATSDVELEAVFRTLVSNMLVDRWHIYGP